MNRRPRIVAGIVTASVLLLSACAASGPRPGVGVTVDDQVITAGEVDTAARGLCTFFAEDVAASGGAVAYLGIRQNVAVLLALRSAATQLADEVGAEPGPDYRRQLSSLERETADVEPAAEREALISAVSAEPYVLALVPQIGAALLRAEGDEDASLTAATTRGIEALTSFLSEGGVDFAPSLGLTYRGGDLPPEAAEAGIEQVLGSLFELTDSSTSVGVSATAEGALEPGADYAGSLPPNQRCGG